MFSNLVARRATISIYHSNNLHYNPCRADYFAKREGLQA